MAIPITYLRSSSYNTHEMCEMQLFISYILGFPGKVGLAAQRGTIVHACLEVTALYKQALQNGRKSFKHNITGRISTKKDLDLDKVFEKCYTAYSEDANHLIWLPKHKKETRKWLEKAITYNDGQFCYLNQTVIQPEQFFDIELKDDWATYTENGIEKQLRLKGTIDLITELKKDVVYEIIDFKTGKRLNWNTGEKYSYNNLHMNFQLRLYYLVATILFPHIETFVVTIYYINDGGAYTLTFNRDDNIKTLQMIKEKYECMKSIVSPKLSRSWKCRKMCQHGKEPFEKAGIEPLIQNDNGHISQKGEVMCRCDTISYCLRFRSLQDVMDNMTKDNFNPSIYQEPGAIDQT